MTEDLSSTIQQPEGKHMYQLWEKCLSEAGNIRTNEILDAEGRILAPDGKKVSKYEGWRRKDRSLDDEDLAIIFAKIIRTPSFRAWYGNGQYNYSTKEPRVAFHGTAQHVPIEEGIRGRRDFQRQHLDRKVYVAPDPAVAHVFALKERPREVIYSGVPNMSSLRTNTPAIFPVFVRIERPVQVRNHRELMDLFTMDSDLEKKYDGIVQPGVTIYPDSGDLGLRDESQFKGLTGEQAVVFSDEQIMAIPVNFRGDKPNLKHLYIRKPRW